MKLTKSKESDVSLVDRTYNKNVLFVRKNRKKQFLRLQSKTAKVRYNAANPT